MATMDDINKYLRTHNATIDKDNRLYMSILCDGSLCFLFGMVTALEALGCTDIKHEGRMVTEGIPEDKPWCNYLYEASGVLPDYILYTTKPREGEVDHVSD